MKNDALARLFYSYMAVYIAVSAFAAPCSATSVMLVRDGFWGYAVTCGTAALAAMIAVDVAINDWLPDKYVFHWAKAHRHWFYAITAGAYVTPIFSASAHWTNAVVNTAQFTFYIGMALFGLVLGYREAQAKRRGLAVMLALIGGTASTFQRLASSDPLVRSVAVEVGSVITASIVAGLAAFFFCMWRGWPAPLTAFVITLSSWGGKRVLDQALDAWVRKIQGEKV